MVVGLLQIARQVIPKNSLLVSRGRIHFNILEGERGGKLNQAHDFM